MQRKEESAAHAQRNPCTDARPCMQSLSQLLHFGGHPCTTAPLWWPSPHGFCPISSHSSSTSLATPFVVHAPPHPSPHLSSALAASSLAFISAATSAFTAAASSWLDLSAAAAWGGGSDSGDYSSSGRACSCMYTMLWAKAAVASGRAAVACDIGQRLLWHQEPLMEQACAPTCTTHGAAAQGCGGSRKRRQCVSGAYVSQLQSVVVHVIQQLSGRLCFLALLADSRSSLRQAASRMPPSYIRHPVL